MKSGGREQGTVAFSLCYIDGPYYIFHNRHTQKGIDFECFPKGGKWLEQGPRAGGADED